jgi:hypothetical protein
MFKFCVNKTFVKLLFFIKFLQIFIAVACRLFYQPTKCKAYKYLFYGGDLLLRLVSAQPKASQ